MVCTAAIFVIMSGMATPSSNVSYLLARVARVHRTVTAQQLAPLGLYPGQDVLLGCLWQQDGQTQSELVEQLGVEPPTVTKMVQRLEEGGFVRRRAHPTDRRATVVWLTAAGRKVRPKVQRAITQVNRELFGDLSDRQVATMETLLGRVLDHRNG